MIDYYDEADAVAEPATVSASAAEADADTQTDHLVREPSYADFLIAYSTQSCKLHVVANEYI